MGRKEATLVIDETCMGRHMQPPGAGGKLLAIAMFAFAAQAALPGAVARGAELSGKDVVDAVCAACHSSGAQGAPKIGDQKAWSKRAAHGLSNLTASALKGIRQMPPHGGNMNLTDLEIKRGIAYMVNQSGGNWTEPISTKSPPVARTGEAIVKAQCIKCHQDGKGGAPRIGDRVAWIPRLKDGLDGTVRSAMKGHGGMPARGGLADLSDAELRNAVIYLFRGPNPAK
jgi:cytochrome c5